jgi:hypothetical protein
MKSADLAGCEQRDVQRLLQPLRHREHGAIGEQVTGYRRSGPILQAGRDVDGVGTGRLHDPRLFNDLIGRHTASHIVADVESHDDREVRPDLLVDPFHDPAGEAGPVLDTPAVLVRSPVGDG